MSQPCDKGFYLPADWQAHDRCWMAWPGDGTPWPGDRDAARDCFVQLAKAIAGFEPVTVIANPEEVAEVSLDLGSGIATVSQAHSGCCLRDIGITFLVNGKGDLASLTWPLDDGDPEVVGTLAEHAKAHRFEAPEALRDLAFQVDGEGTLLACEEALSNGEKLNPDQRARLEALFSDWLGVRKTIWLGEGLRIGAQPGRIESPARFAAPGVLLLHACNDADDPNHAAYLSAQERLQKATDAQGRSLEILELEQPKRKKLAKGVTAAVSYLGFYIANEGVVMPAFDDPRDDPAFDQLVKCFGGREVVQVLALDLLPAGGIHRLTLTQPRPE